MGPDTQISSVRVIIICSDRRHNLKSMADSYEGVDRTSTLPESGCSIYKNGLTDVCLYVCWHVEGK